MFRIKRLITRFIALVAVAAVALALLPSPAAADHTTKVVKSQGNICGYSQDKFSYDSNGDIIEDGDGNPIPGKKYLMKYKKINPNGLNEPHNLICADNTDGPGGTAQAMSGSTTSASTIAGIFGGQGSTPGRTLTNRCVDLMFRNAARVPYSGTTNYDDPDGANYVDPDGSSGNTIYIHRRSHLPSGFGDLTDEEKREERTHDANDRVLDFQDLVAGVHFCSSGKL